MLKKLVYYISLVLFLVSCASIQPIPNEPKMSDIHVPGCIPGHVIFIENIYKDAWVEIADGMLVRRVELGMADDGCMLQSFSPPMFGFFIPQAKMNEKVFYLWKGIWIPSEEVVDKGHYEYVQLAIFKGKTVQGVYDVVADFVKTVLIKEKE